MEALAAVGLASNILQFLDFSKKIVSESREIYSSASGTTKEFESLEKMCQFVSGLSAGLLPPLSPKALDALPPDKRPIEEEITLARLALQCKQASDSLYRDLKKMSLEGSSPGRAASFRQTAKNWASLPRIKNLQKIVEGSRSDMTLCLQAVMTKKQSSVLRYLDELRGNLVHEHSVELKYLKQLVDNIKTTVDKLAVGMKGDSVSLGSISEQLDKISAASKRHWVAEHALVETLFYKTLSIRHESIPEAHKESLKWLFPANTAHQDDIERPKTTILDWFRTGEGTYWVSGKPGSGKSTLMKFMASNPQVRAALNQWSGAKECIMAAYYFWNAGTQLQKSVEGLLRSLLFDIFARNPELIPMGVPELWEAVKNETQTRRYHVTGSGIVHSWTVAEMVKALTRLSSTEVPKRFCLFIDGLDEYHGDHLDLLKIVKILAQGHSFKLCVSSRPWNVFEDALGLDAQKKFYVHDLTRRDIQQYISSTLEENMHWRTEAPKDRRYQNLTDEITERAQGVFLWVALVVRSVQEGLTNGDSIQLIQRRTRELPNELGPFFRHILTSIPAIYHQWMALYFRAALQAPEPPTMMLYSFLDDRFERSLGLSDAPIRPIGEHDIDFSNRLMLARRRLNARSKGLLESYKNLSMGEACLVQEVMFLHRTVRDFLLTTEMVQFLDEILGGYPVNTVVLGAYVELMEKVPGTRNKLVEQAMFYGGKAEKESPEAAVECITKLGRMMPDLSMVGERSQCMINYIFRNGLGEYVKHHTSIGSMGFQSRSQLLRLALQSRGKKINGDLADRVGVAKALLEADTQVDDGMWAGYAESLPALAHDLARQEDALMEELEMFELILTHANNVNLTSRGGDVVWGGLFKGLVQNLMLSPNFARGQLKLLQTLFALGADPNAPCSGTIWSWFSCHVRERYSVDFVQLDPIATIIEMLVKAGANLNHWDALTAVDINKIFPPRLADRIIYTMEQQQQSQAHPKNSWILWIGSRIRFPVF